MEVKIKSMKYEDFKDNEYIEHLVDELKASHTNVVVGCLDELINWGRSNSLLSTGDARIPSGRLPLRQVAVVSSSCRSAQRGTIWPVSGLK